MICQLHTKFQNIFGELPYNFRLVDDSDQYNIYCIIYALVKCRPPADFLSPFGFPSRGTVKYEQKYESHWICGATETVHD